MTFASCCKLITSLLFYSFNFTTHSFSNLSRSYLIWLHDTRDRGASLMWLFSNLPCVPATCDKIRTTEYASFQSDRRHRYSLVDSTPTTKEETFEMPPWSSSAGPSLSELRWSVAISWPRPDLHSGTGMMSWFLKHYCPRVRFMVKVWSFLCMLSSRPDCRIAPCSSLSAPVDVRAELMRMLDWKIQQTQRNNLTNTTHHTFTMRVKSASSYTYHSVPHLWGYLIWIWNGYRGWTKNLQQLCGVMKTNTMALQRIQHL